MTVQSTYRTDSAQPFVLPVVLETEEELVAEIRKGQANHEYLPVLGLQVVWYHSLFGLDVKVFTISALTVVSRRRHPLRPR